MRIVRRLARRSGYGLVISPMFEDAAVFRRGVGEESDVVTKEMYEFEDKGGRLMALRPEGTASVVRAFLQHRPPVPYKAWYCSPAFRYEHPQAGRFREHHQLGVEALGTDDPDLDVEVIALAWRASPLEASVGSFATVGELAQAELDSGTGVCYALRRCRELLLEHLRAHESELCDEHRVGYEKNPLRVLDCKRSVVPSPSPTYRAAPPRLTILLSDPCPTAPLERVQVGLGAIGIDYELDPMLVRGLDYYTRTAFEFASAALEAAQNALGGGGRYDGLAAALGGPDTPGIGFAAWVSSASCWRETAEGVLKAELRSRQSRSSSSTSSAATRRATSPTSSSVRPGSRADRALRRPLDASQLRMRRTAPVHDSRSSSVPMSTRPAR